MSNHHERARFGRNGTEQEPSRVTTDILTQLAGVGLSEPAVIESVRGLVAGVEAAEESMALGLIYRDEGYVRPVLDVALLWSPPLDSTADNHPQELATLGDLHERFAEAIDPRFDTFLDLVDLSTCPTVEAFNAALNRWSADAHYGRVLACHRIEHPLSVAR